MTPPREPIITSQPSALQLNVIHELMTARGLSNTEQHAELTRAVTTGETRWGVLTGSPSTRYSALIAQLRGLR